MRRAQIGAAGDRERRRRPRGQILTRHLRERQPFERDLAVLHPQRRGPAELERPPVCRDTRGRYRALPSQGVHVLPGRERRLGGEPPIEAGVLGQTQQRRERRQRGHLDTAAPSPFLRVGSERDLGRFGSARQESESAAVGRHPELELGARAPERTPAPRRIGDAHRDVEVRLVHRPGPLHLPRKNPRERQSPRRVQAGDGKGPDIEIESISAVGISIEAAPARGAVRETRRRVLDHDPVLLERQHAFQPVELLAPKARFGQDERNPAGKGRGHAVERKASGGRAGDRQVEIEELQHALDGPREKLRHEAIQAIGASEGPAPADLPGEGESGASVRRRERRKRGHVPVHEKLGRGRPERHASEHETRSRQPPFDSRIGEAAREVRGDPARSSKVQGRRQGLLLDGGIEVVRDPFDLGEVVGHDLELKVGLPGSEAQPAVDADPGTSGRRERNAREEELPVADLEGTTSGNR